MFKTGRAPIQATASPVAKAQPISRTSQHEAELQQLADRIVLKEHAPPGVIVNDTLEILQFRGRTSLYLEPASGRANLNILNMVREELAIALRTAIVSARKKAAPIKKKNVAFEHNGKRRVVHLSVIPMDEQASGMGRCYLILFEDAALLIETHDKTSQRLPLKASDLARRTLLEQKRELQAARALLKDHLGAQEALREDFQSANEEMLSANEELQSTNEELETSKEELQATNEELNTVNDELNSNNSTLHLLGNDLKNLLESTVIPIVMVDNSLCIRRLILLSLTDMTKRKKIEAALIQAEKLAIASRLAATIAHEINNPLEAITNLLYLASTGNDAAAAKSYAVQALEEVGRVSHITQQTLKFYRQSTAPSSVQVSEILDSLLVLCNGKLLANNISVHRQYREGPPILCLAGDLRQIFANIIANAVAAMKSGGSLTMRVSASFDWRNQERAGVRTTIADSGTGMDTETLGKIYEPFFTTKNETGTGLGMWVSAQLVERLQGDLRVSSTTHPGRSGTAFSLFLPFERSK